jgi:hypothetical protein
MKKPLEELWDRALKKKDRGIKIPELTPKFNDLWTEALPAHGGIGKDVLQGLNFPARISLAALGTRQPVPLDDAFIEAVIEKAYDKPAIKIHASGEVLRTYLRKIATQILKPKPEETSQSAFSEEEVRQGVDKDFAEAVSEVARDRGIPNPLTEDLLLGLIARVAARRSEVSNLGVNASDIEAVLRALLVNRLPLGNVLTGKFEGEQGRRLLGVIVRVAANEFGVPFAQEEEALAAVQLLVTGEFFKDAVTSVRAVLLTVPELLVAVPGDVVHLPRTVVRLGRAVVHDIPDIPEAILSAVRTLVNSIIPGREDDQRPDPELLNDTLRVFYQQGTFRSVAELLNELLAPENESLRLALVLYARANGIRIRPEDIDLVRTHLLDPDNPNLGPLITAGVRFGVDEYGRPRLERILRKLVPV